MSNDLLVYPIGLHIVYLDTNSEYNCPSKTILLVANPYKCRENYMQHIPSLSVKEDTMFFLFPYTPKNYERIKQMSDVYALDLNMSEFNMEILEFSDGDRTGWRHKSFWSDDHSL